MTKSDKLLEYLRKNKYIFPLAAIHHLGDTRLADTVFKLREKGHKIETEMVILTNRYGEKVIVARYFLIKEKT